MMTIKKDEYIFSVDVEKTKEYYRTHSMCECTMCRNFRANVKKYYPELTAFLSEFGIDVLNSQDIGCFGECSADYDLDYEMNYLVYGTVEEMGMYEIDIYGEDTFVSLVITDGMVSSHEGKGECFTISVMSLYLPWVLDEDITMAKQAHQKEEEKRLALRREQLSHEEKLYRTIRLIPLGVALGIGMTFISVFVSLFYWVMFMFVSIKQLRYHYHMWKA